MAEQFAVQEVLHSAVLNTQFTDVDEYHKAVAAVDTLVVIGREVLAVHERQFGTVCGCRHGGEDRICKLRAWLKQFGEKA